MKIFNKILLVIVSVIAIYAAGLIASDISSISEKISLLKIEFIPIILGLVIGLSFFFISSLSTSNSIVSIFLAGFIAISAMLLPGISGSYILLILGKYEFMLDSISSLNWINIFVFSLGAIVGILSFSKMSYFLLNNYYRTTLFFLSGLMMGALNKVWPWEANNHIVLPQGDIIDVSLSVLIFIFSGIVSYYLKSK